MRLRFFWAELERRVAPDRGAWGRAPTSKTPADLAWRGPADLALSGSGVLVTDPATDGPPDTPVPWRGNGRHLTRPQDTLPWSGSGRRRPPDGWLPCRTVMARRDQRRQAQTLTEMSATDRRLGHCDWKQW